MNTKKITIKVPREYRFVTTFDAHCYQIVSAYIRVKFNPETILVSKEGKKVSIYNVERHASDLFHATYDMIFHKGKEWYCHMIDGCDAVFGINVTSALQRIVADINEKGNFVLLPYNRQKLLREFKVTDEHRKTFDKYQKRLKRYYNERTIV